jgi:hypothetical protein
MKTNRVIIAGSRTTPENNKELLEQISQILPKENLTIVSGTARGGDRLGENWAKENGVEIRQFPAEWNKHGKSAGMIRNKEMAEYATELLLIWDGESRGSANMKKEAEKRKLKITEIICK